MELISHNDYDRAKMEITRLLESKTVSRRLGPTWQKRKEGLLERCLTPPSRPFFPTSMRDHFRLAYKNSELLAWPSRQGGAGAKTHDVIHAWALDDGQAASTSPSSLSAGRVVATFSNDGDHLRGARVFNKPVKARPRICLPSAFVTLLVLWLESEPTWKKGSAMVPEQIVRVCPVSTRRAPLSAAVPSTERWRT